MNEWVNDPRFHIHRMFGGYGEGVLAGWRRGISGSRGSELNWAALGLVKRRERLFCSLFIVG